MLSAQSSEIPLPPTVATNPAGASGAVVSGVGRVAFPVAAVDLTNDGAVYVAGERDDVLAAVAAALLLYQDPLQASERFRDP